MKRIAALVIAAVVIGTLGLVACDSQADVASSNLSKAAEDFEVNRRIVFYNGITDTYMLVIEGRCSIEAGATGVASALEVTCKVGPGEIGEGKYKKRFLGLSDNVTFVVEQLEAIDVSVYHHRVFFRPQQIIPDIDLETGR